MKYTLCLTRQCNLDCTYCYIGKQQTWMSPVVARKIVDFIFALTPAREKMDIGFFGGEPLLEFELIRTITEMIESHPDFGAHPVDLAIVTNGTIFSEAIAAFVKAHDVGFTISCDGPPSVQDRFRRFRNGSGGCSLARTCGSPGGMTSDEADALPHAPRQPGLHVLLLERRSSHEQKESEAVPVTGAVTVIGR
jgi:uncharacterized protein